MAVGAHASRTCSPASSRRRSTRLRALASSGALHAGAAARRHRQRQDRDLPAARRRACAARGRGVLLLVPEIALTPAVAALFRAAFGDRVAIQHSGLSDGERHDQWQRIRRGDVDVVVGTRSAVFAPLRSARADRRRRGARRLVQAGREPALPRPRRRGRPRAAGRRARRARLGDAVARELPQRADRPLRAARRSSGACSIGRWPTVRDRRHARGVRRAGPGRHPERAAARGARRRGSQRGEQAIVLLNRRGFATVVFCRQCGATLECPNCSVSLTVHKRGARARAATTATTRSPLPKACAKCAGPYLEQLGFGTERVEAEVRDALPGGARRARRPRHDPAARRDRRAAGASSPPASSTSSSARR